MGLLQRGSGLAKTAGVAGEQVFADLALGLLSDGLADLFVGLTLRALMVVMVPMVVMAVMAGMGLLALMALGSLLLSSVTKRPSSSP